MAYIETAVLVLTPLDHALRIVSEWIYVFIGERAIEGNVRNPVSNNSVFGALKQAYNQAPLQEEEKRSLLAFLFHFRMALRSDVNIVQQENGFHITLADEFDGYIVVIDYESKLIRLARADL
jgi:hypothetical protein